LGEGAEETLRQAQTKCEEMKIRDAHSSITGKFETITMPSGGLEVIGDDGRTMYTIDLKEGVLRISAGMLCKINGVVLDDSLVIIPHACNVVVISRPKYDRG